MEAYLKPLDASTLVLELNEEETLMLHGLIVAQPFVACGSIGAEIMDACERFISGDRSRLARLDPATVGATIAALRQAVHETSGDLNAAAREGADVADILDNAFATTAANLIR